MAEPGDHTEPEWVRHVIWWQVYPLGFVGAYPLRPGGRPRTLRAITDWLDYAIELGASGLALGPIFESQTHGYDTVDHLRIDPRLGDEDDFHALVHAVHERGLRLMLDGVFNHVGRGFPALQRAYEQGPGSADAAWFRPWPTDDGTTAFENFEGNDDLILLNHAEPAVADYVRDVIVHWLDRGADAWRLDAAYAVDPQFWATVLPPLREHRPDAYIVGEVIHGDYAGYVRDSGIDAVTQYELWKAIWSSLNDPNFFELSWALERHDSYVAQFAPLTFVGNHDVTRIATQLTDARHLSHALLILMTVGGTPSVYYGDEQGFTGTKQERYGGDDAVRPEFPREGPDGLSGLGWPIYRDHQRIIGIRRRHPWLHRARTVTLQLSNETFVYEVKADGQSLVVGLNTGEQPSELGLPAAHTIVECTDGAAATMGGTSLLLPAHGWAVLAPA